jgi:hypothetical protein
MEKYTIDNIKNMSEDDLFLIFDKVLNEQYSANDYVRLRGFLRYYDYAPVDVLTIISATKDQVNKYLYSKHRYHSIVQLLLAQYTDNEVDEHTLLKVLNRTYID